MLVNNIGQNAKKVKRKSNNNKNRHFRKYQDIYSKVVLVKRNENKTKTKTIYPKKPELNENEKKNHNKKVKLTETKRVPEKRLQN